MNNILKNTTTGTEPGSPWLYLLILGGYVLTALFLFNYLGLLIVMGIYGIDHAQALALFTNPYTNGDSKVPLLIIQGVTSLGAFVIVPFAYMRWTLSSSASSFFQTPTPASRPMLMTAAIVFCFMVANSVVVEWNQNIDLPDFISGFEQWAQSKEAQLEQITRYLTSFDSLSEFWLAMVVIAVLPAVGEELLFRGLVQNLFGKAFANHHVAIWTAAILFGMFHLQFYGVVPRIFLGALFGYIYYWSGHLSLAMVGHFVNNGLTLCMLYAAQLGYTSFDPMDDQASPPLYVTALFFVVGGVLLYLFKNYFALTKNA
ncbi:CPBP family intramembrane glutamic endopeptidase [Marinoscillum furvescens]|uniref:CAAX prenyl protease 2/Lysostaphin resistance protein A-like domain-containing protein n=1 Tax=Marinoscillum furvescens DSM 4134 TaxID=1122208 RepID=A0A3D9L4I2_MARFU|nr:CPBP family intramembrane glutamic endopeptidase [Marinoscillum furvescens]RED99578.1 hypothetical protein C7460_108200 [Marinoscillum furvescens DSM 4134]